MSRPGWKVLVPCALVVAPPALLLAGYLASATGVAHAPIMLVTPTDCGHLEKAALVEGQPPLLVLHARCRAGTIGAWDAGFGRLAALSLADGVLLGEHVDRRSCLVGLTGEEAWIARGADAECLGLPDLRRRHRLASLLSSHPELHGIVAQVGADGSGAFRLAARDGRQYRLTVATATLERLPLDPPPPAPTLLAAWAECEWRTPGLVYEARTCQPMMVEGDAVAVGPADCELVVSRLGTDGGARWQVGGRELFGRAGAYRLLFAAGHAGQIVLVATEREPDDLHVAAIADDDGAVRWSRTFW